MLQKAATWQKAVAWQGANAVCLYCANNTNGSDGVSVQPHGDAQEVQDWPP